MQGPREPPGYHGTQGLALAACPFCFYNRGMNFGTSKVTTKVIESRIGLVKLEVRGAKYHYTNESYYCKGNEIFEDKTFCVTCFVTDNWYQ